MTHRQTHTLTFGLLGLLSQPKILHRKCQLSVCTLTFLIFFKTFPKVLDKYHRKSYSPLRAFIPLVDGLLYKVKFKVMASRMIVTCRLQILNECWYLSWNFWGFNDIFKLDLLQTPTFLHVMLCSFMIYIISVVWGAWCLQITWLLSRISPVSAVVRIVRQQDAAQRL